MAEQIQSIESIERQGREAAHVYTNVNDACPYSFYTAAGRAFKTAFQKERIEINRKKNQSLGMESDQ